MSRDFEGWIPQRNLSTPEVEVMVNTHLWSPLLLPMRVWRHHSDDSFWSLGCQTAFDLGSGRCWTPMTQNWRRRGILFDWFADFEDLQIPEGSWMKLNDFLNNAKALKRLNFYHPEYRWPNFKKTHGILIVGLAVLFTSSSPGQAYKIAKLRKKHWKIEKKLIKNWIKHFRHELNTFDTKNLIWNYYFWNMKILKRFLEIYGKNYNWWSGVVLTP